MTREELLPHIPARLTPEEQEAWIQSVLDTHPGHKTGDEPPMQPEAGMSLDEYRRAISQLIVGNFGRIEAQFDEALKRMSIPAAQRVPAFDATGIERGLKAVQQSVTSIPAPAPINLDGIRQSIGEMHATLDNLGVENRVAHREMLQAVADMKPIGITTELGLRVVEVPKLIEAPAPVDRWKTPFRLAVLVLLAALFALSARGQDPATIIRDPAYKPSAGGASPAGSNGDVQMKSGAALAASLLNMSGAPVVKGLSYPAIQVVQGGTVGSTAYTYCIVGTDSVGGTRQACASTSTGNATLSVTNYNTVRVPAWASTSPYIAPTGACLVYRTAGGSSQGLLTGHTLSSCAAGGTFDDTGFAGDGSAVPVDTSVVLTSGGPIAPTQLASYGSIAMWGDSLTQGTGGTPYPTQLANIGYFSTFNGGQGGDTSTQIATRFAADVTANCIDGACPHTNWFTIIWAGNNNFGSQATILSDIAGMVAALPSPKRFLILSLDNNTANPSGSSNYNQIIADNAALAAAYPNNYLDIRTLLVNAYNPAVAQDVTDHGNDVPPSSLRFDTIHLNTAGYLFVAQQINSWLLSNGAFTRMMSAMDVQRMLAYGPSVGNANAYAPGAFSQISIAGKLLYPSGDGQGSLSAQFGIIPTLGSTYNLGFGETTLNWNNGYFANLYGQVHKWNQPIPFSVLSVVTGDGKVIYCSDCKNKTTDGATAAAACVGSGTGALARRENGVWNCN